MFLYFVQCDFLTDDPNFFKMVEDYFDRGAALAEDRLVDTMKGRISNDEKRTKVK